MFFFTEIQSAWRAIALRVHVFIDYGNFTGERKECRHEAHDLVMAIGSNHGPSRKDGVRNCARQMTRCGKGWQRRQAELKAWETGQKELRLQARVKKSAGVLDAFVHRM